MSSDGDSIKTSSVNSLLQRVSAMEQLVYGNLDKNAEYPQVTDTLLEVSGRLGEAVGGSDRAVMVMKRIDELQLYLDPLRCHQLSASPDQLSAEVAAVEPQLRHMARQLQLVRQLEPVVQSQPIRDAGSLAVRVQQLNERHRRQWQQHTQLVTALQQLKQACCQLTDQLAVALIQLEQRTAQL